MPTVHKKDYICISSFKGLTTLSCNARHKRVPGVFFAPDAKKKPRSAPQRAPGFVPQKTECEVNLFALKKQIC